MRCTDAASKAPKPIPEFNYECSEGSNEDNLKTVERHDALKAYLKEIEKTFADPAWWATPVDDLNACSTIKEVRAMTDDERNGFLRGDNSIGIYGDQSTRLITVTDPCIKYSYITLNAYVLQHVGNRVYATQVLDAFFSRADNSVAMEMADNHGERLLFIESRTVDGMMPPMPYTTYSVFSIDPRTHRAVPKKIFKKGHKLINRFRVDDYMPEEEDVKPMRNYRSPEIIHNDKLSPRFYIYKLGNHHLYRSAYIWNGRYYQPSR